MFSHILPFLTFLGIQILHWVNFLFYLHIYYERKINEDTLLWNVQLHIVVLWVSLTRRNKQIHIGMSWFCVYTNNLFKERSRLFVRVDCELLYDPPNNNNRPTGVIKIDNRQNMTIEQLLIKPYLRGRFLHSSLIFFLL